LEKLHYHLQLVFFVFHFNNKEPGSIIYSSTNITLVGQIP